MHRHPRLLTDTLLVSLSVLLQVASWIAALHNERLLFIVVAVFVLSMGTGLAQIRGGQRRVGADLLIGQAIFWAGLGLWP